VGTGAPQDPDRGGSLTGWLSNLLSWSSKSAKAPRPPETVRYGSHPDQVADLWLPEGPGPYAVVVSIHGGYFARRYRRDLHDPMARRLATAGLAVLNVEYRRAKTGGTLANTTDDVMSAISALRLSRHDLRDAVCVVGHSAGGYLALWAASHPDVELVVGLAAAADLVDCTQGRYDGGAVAEWLGATPAQDPELYRRSDLLVRLPTTSSTRLVHGTADRTVPIHQSQRYVDRASQVGDDSSLVALEGEGHFGVIDPRDPAFDTWLGLVLQWAKIDP
jgi:dipeptidyl aminopeptidase/acylaminoacyl peptidase